MAREYGRLYVSIWSDFEFGLLDRGAQWMFFALVSQPGVTPCGVLPYAPNRWANLAPDATPRTVEKALRALEAGRMVVLDRDHDELLIRGHIRWDKPLRIPNTAKAAARSWGHIASPEIRKTVLIEIARLRGEPETAAWAGWSVPEVQELLEIHQKEARDDNPTGNG